MEGIELSVFKMISALGAAKCFYGGGAEARLQDILKKRVAALRRKRIMQGMKHTSGITTRNIW